MKRFLTTILAIIYLATASGASIRLHYCMGQLVGLENSNTSAATKTCPMCGMQKSPQEDNGCCKHEQRSILEKDQEAQSPIAYSLSDAQLTIPIPVFHNRPAITAIGLPLGDYAQLTPPLTDIPLFKRHRNWLI